MIKRVLGIFIICILCIGMVSAITGTIGNVKMILRPQVGDKINKSILVINDASKNNVSIDISLSASGDLADYITIYDKSFTLAPGEEKDARFMIDVKKAGTTESKINVKFSPTDGSSGVGLSSAITVIAGGESEDEENEEDVDVTDTTTTTSGMSKGKIIAMVITGIITLALIVLLVLMLKKVRNKSKKRSEKK